MASAAEALTAAISVKRTATLSAVSSATITKASTETLYPVTSVPTAN